MQQFLDALVDLGEGQALVLGSDGRADVIVPGGDVEQRHARIVCRDRVLFVQDLDSRTGTFVNGREVRGLVELHPGDRLRIGGVELLVPDQAISHPARGSNTTENGALVSPLPVAVVDAVKKVRVRTNQGTSSRAILEGVSFSLEAGAFLGILGASGSGKSTLIKAIAGLTDLTEGAIVLGGERVSQPILRSDRRIAYLPQDVVVHEILTPVVALDYIARLKELGDSTEQRQRLVHEVLERVGLGDRLVLLR